MLVDDVLDAVVAYVSRDETRERLETRVVRPCLDYVGDRVAWNLRLFRLLAALIVLQTAMLAYMVIVVSRRR